MLREDCLVVTPEERLVLWDWLNERVDLMSLAPDYVEGPAILVIDPDTGEFPAWLFSIQPWFAFGPMTFRSRGTSHTVVALSRKLSQLLGGNPLEPDGYHARAFVYRDGLVSIVWARD